MNAIRHLQDLALSDTGFVFDPYTGATFTVNTTGLAVLQALKEGLSREQVAARLADRFEVSGSNDPARDVDEFLQLLRQYGIIPRDFVPGSGA